MVKKVRKSDEYRKYKTPPLKTHPRSTPFFLAPVATPRRVRTRVGTVDGAERGPGDALAPQVSRTWTRPPLPASSMPHRIITR